MHVDRAQFLVLAGSIAAGACTLSISDSGKTSSGTTGAGAASGVTSSSATEGAGSTTSGAGGGCDDSVGTPGDCTKMMTSCKESVLVGGCQGSIDQFKPKVAANAVACMLALPAASTCNDIATCRTNALGGACSDATAADLCAKLVAACNHPMYPLDDAGCHKLVDGLNAKGRTLVNDHCTANDPANLNDCSGGLANCINSNIF